MTTLARAIAVDIPAMSTIGIVTAIDEEGIEHTVVGDHRPVRDIGEAIAAAVSEDDLPLIDLDEHPF